jgi:molybdopterin synthase catalytic subunit
MHILIDFSDTPILRQDPPAFHSPQQGALLEFHGTVRDTEHGRPISAIRYELYASMAESEIRRLLLEECAQLPSPPAGVRILHRHGVVRAGETAVYIAISTSHRAEGLQLLSRFLDRFKQDVPIWKTEVLS